jgi:alkanesulfonate monooxygenase SsuD/methylene tetrahydromethanopterin reductase-like flavin-dependent oxidoreductase (luciferase family)
MTNASGLPERTHPWVAEGQHSVRFGIVNGPREDWETRRAFVAEVERLGFDAYWMADHPTRSNDCWTMLSALALTTRRIRLGPLVDCVSYRSPVLLARLAADVDDLSQGRLVLGLGIGDLDWEFAQLGIACPSIAERQELLDEVLQVVPSLLQAGSVAFHGKHLRLEAELRSGSVQQPRVPLLVGGGGERVTLRQVAQYADAANFGPHRYTGGVRTIEAVRRRLEALRRHCDAYGRPYESILKTHSTYPIVLAETRAALEAKIERFPPAFRQAAQASMLAATPPDAARHYRELAEAGLQYFCVFVEGADFETLELLAERVVPEVAAG